MVRRKDATLKWIGCDEFSLNITDLKEDKFAKTFRSKANMQDLWPCLAVLTSERLLAGAIAYTVSRQYVANLQLLHVFHAFRNMGYGRMLCEKFLENANNISADYFRVSAEPSAVKFYERLGIRFVGKQKSGSSLAMGKLGPTFQTCIYDIDDPVINKAVFSKAKGGCVEVYA